jgi:hypothetical protein
LETPLRGGEYQLQIEHIKINVFIYTIPRVIVSIPFYIIIGKFSGANNFLLGFLPPDSRR